MRYHKLLIAGAGFFVMSLAMAQTSTTKTTPATKQSTTTTPKDTAYANKLKRLNADAKKSRRTGSANKFPGTMDSVGRSGTHYHIDTSRRDSYIIPQ